MYALRIYESSADKTKHTNTVVGVFTQKDKDGVVHEYHYSSPKRINWNLCRLRIWPAEDKKNTVYPLPVGKKLFLFSKSIDEVKLLASVFEPDDYISFQPVNSNDEVFYLVVDNDEEEAKIKIVSLL